MGYVEVRSREVVVVVQEDATSPDHDNERILNISKSCIRSRQVTYTPHA